MSDSPQDADAKPPKPRGLWSVIGQPAPDQQSEAAGAAPTVSDPDAETINVSEQPRKRGLWGMMQTDAASSEAIDHNASPSDTGAKTFDQAPPGQRPAQGLFALMQRGADEVTASEIDDLIEGVSSTESAVRVKDVSASEIDDLIEDLHLEEATDLDQSELPDDQEMQDLAEELPDDEDLDDGPLELPAEMEPRKISMPLIDPVELDAYRLKPIPDNSRRQSMISLVGGLASIAVSALAILPYFWSSFPATVLGFLAMIAGYLALVGPARRRLPSATRINSVAGMCLGTIGIFLGPLFFAGIGRNHHEESGSSETSQHLTQMGTAIDRYYSEHDGFPIGGTFARDGAGVIKGQHGWMTFLLPYVGETELYERIDQSKPFDDPENRAAMTQEVPMYLAAGGHRAKNGQGFAVSHFAGLGGEIDDANGVFHVGIFERDVSIKLNEITDGLGSTVIVGELAGSYPAWGDPENWRKIGQGLNKDPKGFGSASAQGATFLFADGSVKFFNNNTDPKILERLSTRDGGER